DKVLICNDLNHFEVCELHAISTHAAGETLALDDTGCERSVTHRTGSAQPVMLTVGLATYSLKVVTLYNTLEAFSFRGANCIKEIALYKYVLHLYLFTQLDQAIVLGLEITKLHQSAFSRCVGFLEVTLHWLCGVLLF